MIAEFYIVKESFINNKEFNEDEISKKIEALHNDFLEIRKHKETDKLFVHPEVYEIEFLQETSLTDVLYSQIDISNLDRDILTALRSVMVETQTANYNGQQVIQQLLPENNEDKCCGLMAFHQIDGVDVSCQIVYTENSWIKFRRQFLGKYPKNPSFFIDECKKYFPLLYFHERNKLTIGAIMTNCTGKIIYHLAALNDKFNDYLTNPYNRTETLRRFSTGASLDEIASPQGDAAKKPDFTFEFINDANENERVVCEPHLKLPYNDNYPGDASYSTDRRVYFHEGKQNIQSGRILIGHIGHHL